MVEGALLGGQRTEQPVEQKEADAEVLVHQSGVVQHPVMDVMPLSCAPEPSLENRIALHPEVLHMHLVMQIAEHEEGPRQGSPDRHCLIE